MASTSMWEVQLEDGTVLQVQTDQRDQANWEVQPFHADQGRWTLRGRFVAWSAMKRQGAYAKPFEQFNTVDCIEVRVAGDEDDGEDEQGLDPGQPAHTGTRSSTSRSRRGSRSATS